MCVSAWNEFGQEGFVKDATMLYRTDYFSRYAWMIDIEVRVCNALENSTHAMAES